MAEDPSSIPFKHSALTWTLSGLFKKDKTVVFRRKPIKGTQGKHCTNWPGLLPSGAHGLLWGLDIDSWVKLAIRPFNGLVGKCKTYSHMFKGRTKGKGNEQDGSRKNKHLSYPFT